MTPAELHELQAMVAAMQRSLAVIEFELDGTIVRANQKFLDTVGPARTREHQHPDAGVDAAGRCRFGARDVRAPRRRVSDRRRSHGSP